MELLLLLMVAVGVEVLLEVEVMRFQEVAVEDNGSDWIVKSVLF